jgi:hypothetical protein
MEEIINFYSNCKALTEREKIKERLGYSDLEFEYLVDFLEGTNDIFITILDPGKYYEVQ